jgi:hypothetical protein
MLLSTPVEESMSTPLRFPSPQLTARKGSKDPNCPPREHPWQCYRVRLKKPQQAELVACAKLRHAAFEVRLLCKFMN